MKVVVECRTRVYIEAENLHECAKIWDNADLEMYEDLYNGKIETELVDMLKIYNEDTEEEIKIKDFK